MGKVTKISWSHSTYNFFIGCSHAKMEDGSDNPLCTNCYAERENAHWKWNGGSWGPGAPRKLTSEKYQQQPFKWNEDAEKSGDIHRVFAFSLADVWDVEAPLWPEGRESPYSVWVRKNTKHIKGQLQAILQTPYCPAGMSAKDVFLRSVVETTPHLTWMLLTKRYKACVEDLQQRYGDNPPRNMWVVFSAGTQETLEEAVAYGLQLKTSVFGISAEPLLGPMDFTNILIACPTCGRRDDAPTLSGCFDRRHGMRVNALSSQSDEHYFQAARTVNWVITGGESGPNARPMRMNWEKKIRVDCQAYGVPYFFKQAGAVALISDWRGEIERIEKMIEPFNARVLYGREREECLAWPEGTHFGNRTGNPAFNGQQILLKHQAGTDPSEWPDAMKVQQFPE